MIRKNSDNYKIIKHFLNVGPLTAAEACQTFVSNNLRSRVPELIDMGFDVVSEDIPGKTYCLYKIALEKIEKNRELFRRNLLGKSA